VVEAVESLKMLPSVLWFGKRKKHARKATKKRKGKGGKVQMTPSKNTGYSPSLLYMWPILSRKISLCF